jgi:tripartite-type tricarboxylate transporter receptor subunit TctC
MEGRRGRLASFAFAMLTGASIALSPGTSSAQNKYPDRPIRIVVPFAAGGATDIAARILSQGLTEAFNQTVVVENRPGAGSNLGAAAVAHAEPDGYTLLLASSGIIASPALYKKLTYDIFTDLTPIAELVGTTNIIVVAPNSSIGTIKQMVERAKSNPGQMNYVHPGVGTTPQLAMELLKLRAGISITSIAYGGAAPASQAIVAGTVEIGAMALSNIHGQVKGGAFRGIAVTGAERWPDLPDVPTVQESGYPDFDFETIFILMAPARTPPDIIRRLSEESIRILKKPDVKQRVDASGFAVLARGPDALKARIAKEVPIYKDIVVKAGIPVN